MLRIIRMRTLRIIRFHIRLLKIIILSIANKNEYLFYY